MKDEDHTMRKFVVILAVLLLPTGLAPVYAATINMSEFGALGKIDKGRSGVPRAETNAATGRSRWGDGAETFALGYTARHGANGNESFMTSRVMEDNLGQVHVRMTQSIAGLRVVGADVIVHADIKTGNVLGMNGRFAVDRGLARHPEVDASVAIDRATRELGITDGRVQGAPELTYIVDSQDNVRLAWSNLVAYQSVEGAELDIVFADAITGTAITRHPQIKRAKNRQVYNCGGGTTVPCSTLVLSEGGSSMDATVTAAYNNAGIA
jgi:Zn-dependent metalloprotease